MAQARSIVPALGAEIREHRIYFEVERETALHGDARVTVALHVWLWATVPKRAGSLPWEPGCRAAVAALRDVARAAVERAGVVPAADVAPFHWALYASRHARDADELRLAIDLRAEPADPADQARREDAIAALRRALEEMGVLEGLAPAHA